MEWKITTYRYEKHESKFDIRVMNDESKVELPGPRLGLESVAWESGGVSPCSWPEPIPDYHPVPPKLSPPQSRHCWPGCHGCYCGTLRQKAGWSLMRIGVKSWIKTHFSICSHSSFKDKWQILHNLLEIWLQIKAHCTFGDIGAFLLRSSISKFDFATILHNWSPVWGTAQLICVFLVCFFRLHFTCVD